MKMYKSMKRWAALVSLMLLVMFPFAVIASDTTWAVVAFKSGGLTWGGLDNTGLDNMNLDFGEHTLPATEITYDSINAPHSIRVEDARQTPDGWNVKVSMTKFADSGINSEFDGMITLMNGISSPGVVDVSDPIYLLTDGANVKVASADVDVNRGAFDVIWEENSYAKLSIGWPEAMNIQADSAYTATLTWTLAATPDY